MFSTFRTKKKDCQNNIFLAGAAVPCHVMAWKTVWVGSEWRGRTGCRTRAQDQGSCPLGAGVGQAKA